MSSSSPEALAQAEKFEKRILVDGVYQLSPDPNQETQQADAEILLFPGLQISGSNPAHAHWRTWKMRNSEECWLETLLPELLKDRRREYRVRVLSVSYEVRLDLGEDGVSRGTGSSDDYRLIESLIWNLILSKSVELGQKVGIPVILVGHDLGGILIKKFVMRVEEAEPLAEETKRKKLRSFLENLKSVFFYSTPHSGAPVLEELAKKTPLGTCNEMLHLMKVLNADMSRLNQDFHNYRSESKRSRLAKFSTNAIHANHNTALDLETPKFCGSFMVVPEGTARSDVDYFLPVNANHFEVCQPEARHSSSAQMLADEIKRVVDDQEASRKNVVTKKSSASAPKPSEVRSNRQNFLDIIDPAGRKLEVSITSSTQASASAKQRA